MINVTRNDARQNIQPISCQNKHFYTNKLYFLRNRLALFSNNAFFLLILCFSVLHKTYFNEKPLSHILFKHTIFDEAQKLVGAAVAKAAQKIN